MPSAARAHVASTAPTTARAKANGADIRARILANRARRLAISNAMKAEAGVTEHTVTKDEFNGLAYIGTGRIVSPEGRNMRQLYIVAHECGHIFLHSAGLGYHLPSHVKEHEAESYAHQAFREHGMEMPRALSDWGRQYVMSWIVKDQAAGVAIDPRAWAYANGNLSSYEPLRMVPATWTRHRAATPALVARHQPHATVQHQHNRRETAPTSRWRRELSELPGAVGSALFWGSITGYAVLKLTHGFAHPMSDLFKGPEAMPTVNGLLASVTIGLLWANLVVVRRSLRL